MRILILTHNIAGVGGSFQRAHSLGRALAGRKHDVILFAARARPGLQPIVSDDHGIRMMQAPDILPRRVRHGGLSPVDAAWRSFVIAGLEADIIHAFDHRPAVAIPALLSRRLKSTVLISDWSDLWGAEGIARSRSPALRWTLGAWDGWAEAALRPRVDAVTTAGSELAARARKLGVAPNRVMILPPGANNDLIRAVDKTVARSRLELPIDARVVVHAGLADYDEKLLTETLAMILHNDQKTVALTAGLEPDGLARLLADGPHRSRWIHLGFVPYEELGIVLAAADVLLLPYGDREINRSRFPNKLGDYLAAGRPIVSNPAGDVGPLIESEGIGMLSEEDPQLMAEAVLALLHDPRASESMGFRARQLADGRYAWETLAEQVEAFYTETLSNSGRSKDRG